MTAVFTSDLTIDETLLLAEVGFVPLELVLAATYVNIGWSNASWFQNQELTGTSQLMKAARVTAMERLLEQAVEFDADGIVGMHVEIEREGHTAEFSAMGTAVRRTAGDGGAWRDANGRPFTCHLSGVDFWALVRGGFRPVCLAHGVCVYHVARQSLGQWWSTVGKNAEMTTFTQALYDAREISMERMQAEARAQGATGGILGVELHEGSHGWDSHILEMVTLGTGVAPLVPAPSMGDGRTSLDPATLVLSLRD